MKIILFALLVPAYALSSVCEVGGISDSPQSYRCVIWDGKTEEKLSLSCKEGSYQIKWQGNVFTVKDAYHEDVESGASPLVFVGDRIKLTTVTDTIFSSAYLVSDGREYTGKCFDR